MKLFSLIRVLRLSYTETLVVRRDRVCYITKRSLTTVIHSDKNVLPVLIVGAGPVGLLLSILLTKLGVKCAVLEKSAAFSKHPQAHFINNRSMEVFHRLNGLAKEIQRKQPPVDQWRKFIYCASLTGPIFGAVDHMQPQDFDKVVSPVSVAHFSQYKLTALLVKKLQEIGFTICDRTEGVHDSAVREKMVLMGHKVVAIDAATDCINVTASYGMDDKIVKTNYQCNFLIGTDGAGSSVRKLIGIDMIGERDLQKLVSVHFMSKDLGRLLTNERPGMLFFIFNTEAIGVLVAHDLEQGEFVLQIPFYPPQQNLKDFSPEMCSKLIVKLVGRELADVDVVDIKPWIMHAEVAEKFMSSDNRIILAGDAAHRFPPAGGFGMNTGIQDVHNLAWKLASVVKGIVSSSILSTYESERKPIAIFNTQLSVQNFRAAMEVPAALGLDPVIANSVHQAFTSGIGSVLPSGIQRALLDGIFSIGRAQLSESFLNKHNPLGALRLRKLKNIFEEGKSLQLQFPAEDLGFRYTEGALISDGDSSSSVMEPPTGRRRDYVPCAKPGSRLPHMNVRLLPSVSSKEPLSTLDLISLDKIEFLLIIAPVAESYNLARAAFEAAKKVGISLRVCSMWPDGTRDGAEAASVKALAPWKNYIDVVEVRRSTSMSWWDICQMPQSGAILVRPDDHIAWRAKEGVLVNPYLEMERVFSTILTLK
uniref:FAD-binding domain-containing protein n=1 Tax=Kalanchoe fedtschenkoi TaxID=63787 RepID=A0A7N0ZZ29_KALFE